VKRSFKFCPLCRYPLRREIIEDRPRSVCRKCGWIDYQNPLPVAVCAAINKKGQILLVKRNQAPGRNKWALPGGFIETNESPKNACLRELKEETNLDGKISGLLGVYLRETRIYGSLIVIGYAMKISKGDISVSHELKEAKFFRREDLPHIPFLVHRKLIKAAFLSNRGHRPISPILRSFSS
jgi:ADP-ribose pyrophosphatase YjhB (NUDIX family)